MCGILVQRGSWPDRQRFAEALRVLRHRGPDGEGLWFDPDQPVAIGHTRLALVGGPDGHQPLVSEDGSVVAVVNGEFYGAAALRERLRSLGHRFATDSDSELAVHAYESFGLEFVQELRGEFALVVWDRRAAMLIAVRDRFGIKPLVYSRRGGHLMLASEAKALFRLGHPVRWDPEAVAQIFTHQYLAPSHSLFADVRQLPPAHLFVHTETSFEIRRYWQPGSPGDQAVDPQEIHQLLDEAVRLRLQTDEAIAFSLSAGIDSSAVVAMASRALGRPVDAFTIGFEDADYDEFPVVRQNAAGLNCRLHRVDATPSRLLDVFEAAVATTEGISINAQLSAKFLLFESIRQAGFKAVLAGEGADEAFLGYAHLQQDAFPDTTLNAPLQQGIMLEHGQGHGKGDGPHSLGPPPRPLDAWPGFLRAKSALVRRCDPYLEGGLRERLGHGGLLARTTTEVLASSGIDPASPLAVHAGWLWTRLALANYILRTLGDGLEMAHSLEGRLPFLDHVLFERAWQAPVDRKLTPGSTKQLLREALSGLLPKELANRPKHPLLAPALVASEEPSIRMRIREFLCPGVLDDLPFIDGVAAIRWLEDLFQRPAGERRPHDPALCILLSFIFLQKHYRPS